MKTYRHIFFDLDRTLWDFDASALIAFGELFEKHNLGQKGIPGVETFQKAYNIHNEKLWALYREGNIQKEVLRGLRFKLTLNDFGIDDEQLAEEIGKEYIDISPLRVSLFPGAAEVLEYVAGRYKTHLITNGFSEVQTVKLKSSGLGVHFRTVVTSEEAGHKKPDPRIFRYAFEKSGAVPEESLMIGDDPEVDIEGARNVGMDQVLFDPESRYGRNGSTYYINELKELKSFL